MEEGRCSSTSLESRKELMLEMLVGVRTPKRSNKSAVTSEAVAQLAWNFCMFLSEGMLFSMMKQG